MELRKRIACLGAALVLLHLCVHAGGYPSLKEAASSVFADGKLFRRCIALELGLGYREAASPVLQATETPAPTYAPTPAPTPTPHVREAIISGGITLDNKTDYTPDVAQMLTEGPALKLTKGKPQILIIHTHSSEAYTMDDMYRYIPSDESRTQDLSCNIIRIGDVLTESLRSYGLEVIHDREIYDYPSYTGSYTRAGTAIEQYLAKYPSVAVVIDVHRDAITGGDVVYKTVAEGEGSPCAQTMFVVGTDASGLAHEHWQENLKLALYLQAAVHTAHPTLQRPIKLVEERYNQQLTSGSLILEVGSNGNTLTEALNAIELFAEAAGPALAQLVA